MAVVAEWVGNVIALVFLLGVTCAAFFGLGRPTGGLTLVLVGAAVGAAVMQALILGLRSRSRLWLLGPRKLRPAGGNGLLSGVIIASGGIGIILARTESVLSLAVLGAYLGASLVSIFWWGAILSSCRKVAAENQPSN